MHSIESDVKTPKINQYHPGCATGHKTLTLALTLNKVLERGLGKDILENIAPPPPCFCHVLCVLRQVCYPPGYSGRWSRSMIKLRGLVKCLWVFPDTLMKDQILLHVKPSVAADSLVYWSLLRPVSFRGEDIHPFCSMVKQPGLVRMECTRDRTAVALCNLERYTDQLPAKYRVREYWEFGILFYLSHAVFGPYRGI